MKWFVVFGTVFLIAAGSAIADKANCTVLTATRDLAPRIGDSISIEFDRFSGSARVDDGFPKRDVLPFRGDIARDDAKILSFTWVQPGLVTRGGEDHQRILLRMSINRNSGRARITGQILSGFGYRAKQAHFSARANCRISEGKF